MNELINLLSEERVKLYYAIKNKIARIDDLKKEMMDDWDKLSDEDVRLIHEELDNARDGLDSLIEKLKACEVLLRDNFDDFDSLYDEIAELMDKMIL